MRLPLVLIGLFIIFIENTHCSSIEQVIYDTCMAGLEKLTTQQALSEIDLHKYTTPAITYLKHLQREKASLLHKIGVLKIELSNLSVLHFAKKERLSIEISSLQDQYQACVKQIQSTKNHITSLASLSLAGKKSYAEMLQKVNELSQVNSKNILDLFALLLELQKKVQHYLFQTNKTTVDLVFFSHHLSPSVIEFMTHLKRLVVQQHDILGLDGKNPIIGKTLKAMAANNSFFTTYVVEKEIDLNMFLSFIGIVHKELENLQNGLGPLIRKEQGRLVEEHFCKNIDQELLPYCDTSKVVPLFFMTN